MDHGKILEFVPRTRKPCTIQLGDADAADLLARAVEEAATLSHARIDEVVDYALQKAEGDYAAAMVLLSDAFELVEERYIGIELRVKAERILGPSRRPGPEAA